MKKLLPFLLIAVAGISFQAQAQCSATSPAAFMNCSYYGDRIIAFTMNGVPSTGNAGCGSNGYNSFATPVRTLNVGQTVSWSATTGAYYANGFGMWIDWNNDGQYTAAECMAFKNYAFTHSGTFQVPFNAVVGTNLRMRIRCAEYYNITASSSPCNSLGGYGETEDYLVYIQCPTSPLTLTVTATNTYVCQGQPVTFTVSGAQNYTLTGPSGAITNATPFNPSASGQYTLMGGLTACPSASNSVVRTVSVSSTPLTISLNSATNTICNGGNTTLTATGASNFTWIPGNMTGSQVIVAPQASTTYTVVGYNGFACPGNTSSLLNVNPQPTISIAATATNVCEGDQVTLTASGAQTYLWLQGGSTQNNITIQPTGPTLYQVTGFNSFNCPGIGQIPIVTKPKPVVNVSTNKSLICVGTSATLTASGGTAYAWSPGGSGNTNIVSPTQNTTYSVVVTGSNGCVNEGTVQVNVYEQTIPVFGSGTICVGEAVNVSAINGTSYSWSNGSSQSSFTDAPVASTVYVLSAMVNTLGMSCPASNSVFVTVNPLPNLVATSSPSSICRNEKSVVSVSGANTYEWSNASSQSSFTMTGNSNTTYNYQVTGTDVNNCKSTATVSVKVNACVGVSDLEETTGVSVYPNPGKGIFNVSVNASLAGSEIRVFNVAGKLVAHQNAIGEKTTINLDGLPAGAYLVEIYSNEVKVAGTRIIKE